jgi:hypothetical protein
MMGKYDESYVYEKENDILSDSDPTDCDTDIDTGQDGGDEDEPVEGEFDFIDNGSYLELDPREDRNTGHCTYYNFEMQRRASRRRTTRKSKQCSEKRRRSSSNKKRHKVLERSSNAQPNGSKSAGATPLSVRRTKHHPVSKLADDCLKKRSNSVSFSRDDPFSTLDKRDKEADQKYRELIVEAEHILRSMKTNGLSPRRVPGPANKRVEILRSAECSRPELFMKNRLTEEPGPPFAKIPSSNFSCPRFSPKRNHITNFMINNSPALMRREAELPTSPLVKRPDSPKSTRRNETNRRSPKYRKKSNKPKLECPSSSTDSDGTKDSGHATKTDSLSFECPQSEPVRRKIYSGRGKTVAFNLNYENVCNNSKFAVSDAAGFVIDLVRRFSALLANSFRDARLQKQLGKSETAGSAEHHCQPEEEPGRPVGFSQTGLPKFPKYTPISCSITDIFIILYRFDVQRKHHVVR